MNNNETLIATKIIDPLNGKSDNTPFKEEETILPPNTEYKDITYDYTDKEIKEIVKGNAYLSIHNVPVTIGYNFPYKRKAYEAGTAIFKTLDEMKEFINNNKGIVIYKMFKRRDETRYGIRIFDGLKFCCRLEYWYNNLLLKLSRLKRKFKNYSKICSNDLSTI